MLNVVCASCNLPDAMDAPKKAAHHAQLASKRAASFGMVKSAITLLI